MILPCTVVNLFFNLSIILACHALMDHIVLLSSLQLVNEIQNLINTTIYVFIIKCSIVIIWGKIQVFS